MFDLLKGMGKARKKRKAQEATDAESLVKHTALNVRIGQTIKIDPLVFLLYTNSTLKPPAVNVVSSISSLKIAGVDHERIELDDGSFIQIYNDGPNPECMYFQITSEVHPQTSEQWDEYLDPIDGMLHQPTVVDELENEFEAVWDGPVQSEVTYTEIGDSVTGQLNAMLFERGLGQHGTEDETTEFLLIQVEEEDDTAMVCGYGGILIQPHDLTIL